MALFLHDYLFVTILMERVNSILDRFLREGQMDFQEAERQFHLLTQQYKAAQISLEEYRTRMACLHVIDAKGNRWQMQERTGTWYVLKQGKWVPGTPPAVKVAVPKPPPAQEVKTSATKPLHPGEQVKTRNRPAWIYVIGVVGILVVCVALAAGGAFVFLKMKPGTTPSGQPSQQVAQETQDSAPTFNFSSVNSVTIPADDQPVTDAHGVTIQVPTNALATGVNANLSTFQMEGDLANLLSEVYTFETPFYQVTALGEVDSTARVKLDFPAPSQDSRLLAVIENEYFALQNVRPEKGKLSTRASLGPNVPSNQAQNPIQVVSGNVNYTVITPKHGTSYGAPSSWQSVAWYLPQAAAAQDCDPFANTKLGTQLHVRGNCRSSPDGSIQVVWRSSLGLTVAEADQLLQKTQEIMEGYASLGFTAAELNRTFPVFVAVETKAAIQAKIPQAGAFYISTNGVVHIPLEDARSLAGSGGYQLAHELAHWIQDEGCDMSSVDSDVAASRWWWETSAENMVMLLHPEYLRNNLEGKYQVNQMGFQTSPFGLSNDWLAYYVQAQLVKVNMCDSADCPISEEGFIQAINEGTYPFKDANAQYMVTVNMDDYARYLVGAAPRVANSGISLDAVKDPIGYGEKANIVTRVGNPIGFGIDTTAQNQIKVTDPNGPSPTLEIVAPIQKDGVYAVELGSGFPNSPVNQAAVLVIPPGPPFIYRLDNGDPITWDGKAQLTIGPISNSKKFGGYANIRLVAYNENDATVPFTAHLGLIDLTGTWVIEQGDQTSSDFSCVDEEGKDVTGSYENTYAFTWLTNVIRAEGQMNLVPGSTNLSWTVIESRVPADTDSSLYTFQSLAEMGGDGIKLTDELDIPQQTSTGHLFFPGAEGLAFAGLLPIAWVRRVVPGKKGRVFLLIAMLILTCLLLAGCVSFDFYGTFSDTVQLQGIQYIGGDQKATYTVGQPVDGKPIWAFTGGTATYTVDFYMGLGLSASESNPTPDYSHCTGNFVYQVTGGVYKDLDLIIPKDTGNTN